MSISKVFVMQTAFNRILLITKRIFVYLYLHANQRVHQMQLPTLTICDYDSMKNFNSFNWSQCSPGQNRSCHAPPKIGKQIFYKKRVKLSFRWHFV